MTRAAEPIDVVELARALVRFDTSNPPGSERACLEFLSRELERAGLQPRVFARDPGRPNLIVRLAGRRTARPLLLHGHVDVVPAHAREWRHPPFAAHVIDDELWGRGALDMKGGIAVLVAALVDLHTAGEQTAGDLVLALTSDEETGSDLGAKYLVEEHAEQFADVRYALGEGGGFTQWIGGRPFYPIAVCEKQRCLLRATIRGEGGHASAVTRETAAGRTGRLLAAIDRGGLPVHVTPVVRHMVSAIANQLPLHERVALRATLIPFLTNRVLDLFGDDGRALYPLLHNTATPTVITGGDSTNVIPTEIALDLDGRLLPGQRPADLIRELDGLDPGRVRYEVVREEPAVPDKPDTTLLSTLADVLRDHDPAGSPFPVLLPGYTDARHFARLGIQTYGYLPLRLPPPITMALIHGPDERVPVDAMRFGVACLKDALRQISTA